MQNLFIGIYTYIFCFIGMFCFKSTDINRFVWWLGLGLGVANIPSV